MTTTLRIIHTGSTNNAPLRVQVWQDGVHPPEPCSPVAEHPLDPGETLAIALREDQRAIVIEHAPTFAESLARYRATVPENPRAATDDEVNRALAEIGAQTP